MSKVTRLPVKKRRRERPGLIQRGRWDPDDPAEVECNHLYVTYYWTEGDKSIECGGCGKELDPIFVIKQLSREESLWRRSRDQYEAWLRAYNRRRRVKCRHCEKMTPVGVRHTPDDMRKARGE